MFENLKKFNKTTIIITVLLIFFLSDTFVSAISLHGTIYDLNLNKVDNAVVEIDTTPKQQLIAKNGTYRFIVNPGDYKIKASMYNGRIIKSVSEENISVIQEGDYVLDIILFPNFQEEDDIINSSEINLSSVDLEKTENNFYLTAIVIILILLIFSVFFYLKLNSNQPKDKKNNKRNGFKSRKLSLKSKSAKRTKKAEEKIEEDLNKKDKLDKTSENLETEPNFNNLREKSKNELKKENGLNKDPDDLLDFIREQEGRITQKDIRKNFPYSEAKISLMISELEDKEIVKKVKKGRGNIIILKNKDI